MTRIFRALASWSALVAAVAMVLAPMLVAAHQAQVAHARCLEHGELIEIATDGHQDHADPVAATPGAVDHDRHCPLSDLLPLTLAGQTSVQVARHPGQGDLALLHSAPPRGPPLAYAPKTSPPTCA